MSEEPKEATVTISAGELLPMLTGLMKAVGTIQTVLLLHELEDREAERGEALQRLQKVVDETTERFYKFFEGKLSNMPTTFQMMGWFVGTSLGICGLAFAIAKLVH